MIDERLYTIETEEADKRLRRVVLTSKNLNIPASAFPGLFDTTRLKKLRGRSLVYEIRLVDVEGKNQLQIEMGPGYLSQSQKMPVIKRRIVSILRDHYFEYTRDLTGATQHMMANWMKKNSEFHSLMKKTDEEIGTVIRKEYKKKFKRFQKIDTSISILLDSI